MNDIEAIVLVLVYLILAPVAGCALAGVDRKLSARMQGRRGPPLRQPYYDIRKFMEKEQITSNGVQDFYVACYLLFVIVTGCMFFAGMDLLLVLFTLTLGETFLILAAYCSGSPFSQVGAQRELYVAMAYEPILLLVAIAFYIQTGSFDIGDIASSDGMAVIPLMGVFVAFLYALTMKLRKSPFDLSMSHHAHQDLVRGMTTEFSGRTLAMLEVSHWYENIMLLALTALFFMDGTWVGFAVGLVVAVLVYLLEVYIDNGFARMKWQTALKSGWVVALILGVGNVIVLLLM